jgi:predicted acyl esterase
MSTTYERRQVDWSSGLPADKHTEWSEDLEVFVAMRDGTRLSTDVLLPKGAEGQLPTILVRTPYDKTAGPSALEQLFLRQGYAVVIQSERGRYFSEGVFGNYLQGASTDGYDTIEWITRQPWSNGKVGTIGCSSTGEHQWALAAGNHPAHAAMIPAASGTAVGDIPANDTRGAIYRGGIPLLGLWAWWYTDAVPAERFVLPPDSTQELRQRLRKNYSLRPKPLVRADADGADARLKHLPSKDVIRNLGGAMTLFEKYITWTPADPLWDEVEQIGAGDDPRVPAIHLNTWHDIGVGEMARLFQYQQERGVPNQHLVIGPGSHCSIMRELMTHMELADLKKTLKQMGSDSLGQLPDLRFSNFKFGDLEIGDARYRGVDNGYTKLFLAWFAQWLAGDESDVAEMPPVQLFVMGKGWMSADAWPPPGVQYTPFYLAPDGGARLRHEDGLLQTSPPSEDGASTFVYDPQLPVPNRGGGCCGFDAALDQRPVEMRRDVLVFSTPPLEEGVTVVGPIEVKLHVSSSARDTDFIVKLVDVHPDGKAINLNDDGFRVRYRNGFDQVALMESGETYEITLPNMVTGNHFPAGHRIRLDITSSCFPLYERNLNTGGNNYDETESVVAENSVHFGPARPSRVVLPILPG